MSFFHETISNGFLEFTLKRTEQNAVWTVFFSILLKKYKMFARPLSHWPLSM